MKQMTSKEEIVANMQQVVEQMFKDDVDENPDSLNEYFDCSACGKNAPLAGSIQYGKYRLCNSCVLLAETGFALKKFDDIQALIDAMEDKRLEELCDFIKKDEASENN